MELIKRYSKLIRLNLKETLSILALMILTGLAEIVVIGMLYPILNIGLRTDTSNSKFMMYLDQLGLTTPYIITISFSFFILLGVSTCLFRYLTSTKLVILKHNLEANMRIEMGEKLLKMNWLEYTKMDIGDLHKSLIIEGNNAGNGLQNFINAAGSLAIVFILLLASVYSAPRETLVVVAFSTVTFTLYKFGVRYAKSNLFQISTLGTVLSSVSQTIFANLKFWKATGNMDFVQKKLLKAVDNFRKNFIQATKVQNATSSLSNAFGYVFIGGIMWVSLNEDYSFDPRIIIFLVIFNRIAPRLRDAQNSLFIAKSHQSWYDTWLGRIQLANQHQEDTSTGKRIDRIDSIRFQGVEYSYPGALGRATGDINFQLKKGEICSLVGQSGAGKSTIVELLLVLIKPTSGSIKINDSFSSDQINVDSFRKKISIVRSESPIFKESILDNIVCGQPYLDLSFAMECVEKSGLSAFINQKEKGIHTILTGGADNLSSGERQRIGLARALYRKPDLLILDEATSQLDSANESIILKSIENLAQHLIVFMISHRLQTTKISDFVMVIEQGRITRMGTYHEVIANYNHDISEILKYA